MLIGPIISYFIVKDEALKKFSRNFFTINKKKEKSIKQFYYYFYYNIMVKAKERS